MKKVYRIFIFLTICFCIYGVSGQDSSRKDSLKQRFDLTPDSAKYDFYRKVARQFEFDSYFEKFDFHSYVLDYSNTSDNINIKLLALTSLGTCYQDINSLNDARAYYKQTIELGIKENDSLFVYSGYNRRAMIHSLQDNFDEALADLYLSERYINSDLGAAHKLGLWNNLGIVYRKMNDFPASLKNYHKALKISKENNFTENEASSLKDIADIYNENIQTSDSAEYYFDLALVVYERNNNWNDYSKVLISLADLKLNSNKINDATVFLERAMDIATNHSFADIKKEAHKIYKEIYQIQGNYLKSIESFRIYEHLNDSLQTISTRKYVEELKLRYETEREYKDNLLNQKSEYDRLSLKKQRSFIYYLFGFILFLSILSIIILRQSRIKSKLLDKLSDSQLQLININKELESSNKTKDRFFSLMAHDLKSPFNSILGFSDILKSDKNIQDNKKAIEYASHIHSSAKKTLHLLENVLQWFGSTMGKVSFNPETFDIKQLVDKNIELYSDMAWNKSIILVSGITKINMVYGDLQMTDAILRNLISNALKFTNNKGSVNIMSDNSKDFVKISVNDNGIGIKKENFESIFEIDNIIKTNGTENETGTGLGLALVKEFVKKNGGKIWLESEPGKGSKFHFTLPVGK